MHADYLIVNTVFLAPLILAFAVRYKHMALRRIVLTLALMCLLTAVFDNLMIGAGIMAYNPDRISGIKIGLAPLEDFAYTLAAVILVALLWQRETKK